MPSTVIASFHYNVETNVLTIVFVSGIVYHYKNVPEKIYKNMKNSTSKGIYFNRNIKDKFEFEKVP
ncbi:MAG: KTSC domain-containing protein [Parafilimonas sp.]|nr:KTSC domain-containing protein [Parafilimonas sp.]